MTNSYLQKMAANIDFAEYARINNLVNCERATNYQHQLMLAVEEMNPTWCDICEEKRFSQILKDQFGS